MKEIRGSFASYGNRKPDASRDGIIAPSPPSTANGHCCRKLPLSAYFLPVRRLFKTCVALMLL